MSLRAAGDPLRVRHPEGTLHGFLSLTTEQGQVLAYGDLNEIVPKLTELVRARKS